MNLMRQTLTCVRGGALCVSLIASLGAMKQSHDGSRAASGEARSTTKEVLDASPVGKGDQYFPVLHYKCTVRSTGEPVCVRWKLPGIEVESVPRGPCAVSVYDAASGRGWTDTTLGGCVEHEGVQLLIEPDSRAVFLVWLARPTTIGSSPSAVLAKLLSGAGGWSDAFTLTDDGAVDITSFWAVARGGGVLEALWTDGRERHVMTWWYPVAQGYPKVFARSWSPDREGPVTRVSRKGRQDAETVRARIGSDGNLIAIWDEMGTDEINQVYLAMQQGQRWSKPVQVSDDPVRMEVLRPGRQPEPLMEGHLDHDIAVLHDGIAWVCWSRDEPSVDVACRRLEKGQLGDIVRVAEKARDVHIGAGMNGTIHLFFEQSDLFTPEGSRKPVPPFHARRLMYVRGSNGVWSKPRVITDAAFVDTAMLAVDTTGRAHLYWQELSGSTVQLVHALAPDIVE